MNQHYGQPSTHRNGAGPVGPESWPSQTSFVNTTWGHAGQSKQPVKHMAKRTPRRRPGSMPSSQHQMPNVTYPGVPTASAKAPAAQSNFVNTTQHTFQSNGHTHHREPRYLPPPRQVEQPSRSSFQNQYAWPTPVREDSRSYPTVGQQHHVESPRIRHNASLPPQTATNRFTDSAYEFRNSAPILEQPHSNGRRPFDWDWQPNLPGLSHSTTEDATNGMSVPRRATAQSPERYITQSPSSFALDDRGPTPPLERKPMDYSWPSCSVPSKSRAAHLKPENYPRPYLQTPTPVAHMNQEYHQGSKYQSPVVASARIPAVPPHKVLPSSASALPSPHLPQTIRESERPILKQHVPREISQPPMPVSRSQTIISNGKSPLLPSDDGSAPPEPALSKVAEPVALGPVKVNGTKKFDSSNFDALIYRQPAASRPPPGVAISTRGNRPGSSSRDMHESESKVYIHANPAIHLVHTRSDEWFNAKSREIKARGNRKFWFGKVHERQRWLRQQRRASQNRQTPLSRTGTRESTRQDPQPRGHSRPLDFSDVPESELPDYVQENPEWLKACEWFRQNQTVRELRARETKRCEEETNNYYKTINGGKMPEFRSRR